MTGDAFENSLVVKGDRLPTSRVMAVFALLSEVIRVIRVLLLEFGLAQERIHIHEGLVEQFLSGWRDIVAGLAGGLGAGITTIAVTFKALRFAVPICEGEFIMRNGLVQEWHHLGRDVLRRAGGNCWLVACRSSLEKAAGSTDQTYQAQ